MLVAIAKSVFSIVPRIEARASFKRAMIRPLIAFGGWMTVSNVLGPLAVIALKA